MVAARQFLPEVKRPALRRYGALREVFDFLVLVGAVYALVNLATARFVVQGPSMQPTLMSDQFLIVSRVNYLIGEPQRGDVIVFHYPGDIEEDYIKRVIGLPGDRVEIRNTRIFVNDEMLIEAYLNEPCTTTRCRDRVWELGADEFFVMGDNRNRSRDSRDFGPIHRDYIVGRALLRYWPLDVFGWINE